MRASEFITGRRANKEAFRKAKAMQNGCFVVGAFTVNSGLRGEATFYSDASFVGTRKRADTRPLLKTKCRYRIIVTPKRP